MSPLWIVGLGPGGPEHRTAAASDAIREADVVIGYGPYVDQCADLLRADQEVIRGVMGDGPGSASPVTPGSATASFRTVISAGSFPWRPRT